MFESCNSILWLVLLGKFVEHVTKLKACESLYMNIDRTFERCKRLTKNGLEKSLNNEELTSEIDFKISPSQFLNKGDHI